MKGQTYERLPPLFQDLPRQDQVQLFHDALDGRKLQKWDPMEGLWCSHSGIVFDKIDRYRREPRVEITLGHLYLAQNDYAIDSEVPTLVLCEKSVAGPLLLRRLVTQGPGATVHPSRLIKDFGPYREFMKILKDY